MDRAENFPPQDRQIICLSLFRAVEWIRSLLSAFSFPQSLPPSENYRLVLRLNQLITIENELYSHCQRYPAFLKLIAPEAKIGVYNPATGTNLRSLTLIVRLGKKISSKSQGAKRGKGKENNTEKGKKNSLESTEVLVMDDIVAVVEKLLRSSFEQLLCRSNLI